MDAEVLRDSPIGGLVSISGTDGRTGKHYDHWAYVPAALPDALELRQETWTAAATAMESLGRLSQACAQLPNPALLIVPALTKEALTTSALEGTYAALPDVLEARLAPFTRDAGSPEVREVVAYEDMARHAFEWIDERPVTVGMLCNLQKILAEGSRESTLDPGQVREHQVVIGPRGCTVYNARFVPAPPGDLLRAGLEQWQLWIRESHDLPVVIRAALAHYQFECLHPFGDGNGRVGRLVIVLQLLREGTLPGPALTLSPWLLERRDEYQAHLLSISGTGDWDPWIQFFCEAIRHQADAHVAVAQRLLDWISDVRADLHERHWSGTVAKLADALIEWPVISARWVQDRYEVSAPTAKSAIDRLVEIGVLHEMSGRRYRRVFGAADVMSAVDEL
ncbi:MAG TPA: Fic family protein [Acidimicrobiales bacterium]|nr:Fic family protein [Acidimicrobiales bacterium]